MKKCIKNATLDDTISACNSRIKSLELKDDNVDGATSTCAINAKPEYLLTEDLDMKEEITMKTIIKGATDDFFTYFDNLDYEFYRKGYDVSIEGDSFENVVITIKYKNASERKYMPKITCWVDVSDLDSDNTVYYEFIVEFPALDSTKLDYADSMEYWIQRWEDVAKVITEMQKSPIELSKFEF